MPHVMVPWFASLLVPGVYMIDFLLDVLNMSPGNEYILTVR
jgi:hypothetical protein